MVHGVPDAMNVRHLCCLWNNELKLTAEFRFMYQIGCLYQVVPLWLKLHLLISQVFVFMALKMYSA